MRSSTSRHLNDEQAFSPRARFVVDGKRAEVLLLAGDEAGARRAFTEWEQSGGGARNLLSRLGVIQAAGQALAALGSAELVRSVYEELADCAPLRGSWFGSLDLMRGDLALRLDLLDEAEQHLRVGLEWCEQGELHIDEGRCLQGLAEVAERRGEQQQAMKHLDAAGELFSQRGAKLYLDQVLAKKQILEA